MPTWKKKNGAASAELPVGVMRLFQEIVRQLNKDGFRENPLDDSGYRGELRKRGPESRLYSFVPKNQAEQPEIQVSFRVIDPNTLELRSYMLVFPASNGSLGTRSRLKGPSYVKRGVRCRL